MKISELSLFQSRWWLNLGVVLFSFILILMVFSNGLAAPQGREFCWLFVGLFGCWGSLQLLANLPGWDKNKLQYCSLITILGVLVWSFVYLINPTWFSASWFLKGIKPVLNTINPSSLAWDQEACSRAISQLLASILFLVGCSAMARDSWGRAQLFWGIIIVVIVESIIGLFSLNLGSNRTFGVLINPNHHAASLFMGIPLLVAWIKESGRRSQERILLPVERDIRSILLILLGLMSLSWLTSFSRGSLFLGWIFLTVWGILEVVGKARFKIQEPDDSSRQTGMLNKLFAIGMLSGFFVVVILFSVDSGRGRSFQESEDAISRIEYWKASWHGLTETSFFGMGFGGSRYAINRYIGELPLFSEPVFAHNDVLQWVCETGIIGSIFLILLWILFFAIVVEGLKKDLNSHSRWRERRMWRAALVAFFVTWCHALFEFHLRVPLVSFQLIVLYVLITSLPRIRCEDLFMFVR